MNLDPQDLDVRPAPADENVRPRGTARRAGSQGLVDASMAGHSATAIGVCTARGRAASPTADDSSLAAGRLRAISKRAAAAAMLSLVETGRGAQ